VLFHGRVDPFLLRGALLLLALAGAVTAGLWHRRTFGRARAVATGHGRDVDRVSAVQLGAPLGDRATLLQISAPVCAPCRVTRRLLAEVAGQHPGVRHVELEADQHLDLVRRLRVLRTPTLLVLDPGGRVVARASGVPGRQQVAEALELAALELAR
jgi:thiol-disulfide isomerase/thioredoxin